MKRSAGPVGLGLRDLLTTTALSVTVLRHGCWLHLSSMSMSWQPGYVVYGGGAMRKGPQFAMVEDLSKNVQRRSRHLCKSTAQDREQDANIIISGKTENIKSTSVKAILASYVG